MAIPLQQNQTWAEAYPMPTAAVSLVPVVGTFINVFFQREILPQWEQSFLRRNIDQTQHYIELKNRCHWINVASGLIAAALGSVALASLAVTMFGITTAGLSSLALYQNYDLSITITRQGYLPLQATLR